MKLLIISGFSILNKSWAEQVQENISPKIETEVHYWQHWQTGFASPNWIEDEVSLLANKVKDESLSFLAKSIGTLALAKLAKRINLSPRKIILCGIPLNDIDDESQKEYKVFSDFIPENIICFQNETDPHGSFTQVQTFLQPINPQIPIISKPRSDHDYPYSTDFLNVLLAPSTIGKTANGH